MSSLYTTSEWKQSMNMRGACDRVLMEVFEVTKDAITRYQKEDGPHVLDQEFAIDLSVLLPAGGKLTGQEKALSNKFAKYRTFTMEFYQNRHTQEPGEFFNIASQFYLSGYSDNTGKEFKEWHIISMLDFMDWLRRIPTSVLEGRSKPAGGSRASFIAIEYERIPKEFIFAQGAGPGNTEVYRKTDSLYSKDS